MSDENTENQRDFSILLKEWDRFVEQTEGLEDYLADQLEMAGEKPDREGMLRMIEQDYQYYNQHIGMGITARLLIAPFMLASSPFNAMREQFKPYPMGSFSGMLDDNILAAVRPIKALTKAKYRSEASIHVAKMMLD